MANQVVYEYDAGVKAVNSNKLHEELKARFGDAVSGAGTSKGRVRVCFDVSPDGAMLAQAQAIVDTHDPDALTPQQQAREDRTARMSVARDKHERGQSLTLRELQELVMDVLGG